MRRQKSSFRGSEEENATLARWTLRGSFVFPSHPFPAPSISGGFRLRGDGVCINRTIWKASAQRRGLGNVDRPRRNLTPAGVGARERGRGRKRRRRRDRSDGHARMESGGLAPGGRRRGSASGGSPSKKVASERLKLDPKQVKTVSHAFVFQCEDADSRVISMTHV